MLLNPGRRVAVAEAHDPLCRRVAELLLRHDNVLVTTSSRWPTELVGLAARGARIFATDPDDRGSLEAAFSQANSLLLLSTAANGVWARRRQLEITLDAAARAGVGRVVYAAVADAFDTSPMTVARDCAVVEQVCEAAYLPLTILRVGWPVEWLFPQIALALRCGKWHCSASDTRLPFVAFEDVARTAASVLLADTVTEGNLAITGPRALTLQDVVITVNLVFGSDIEVYQVSEAALADHLEASYLTPLQVRQAKVMDVACRYGLASEPTDAIKSITGHAACGIEEVLLHHRLDILLSTKAMHPYSIT